jgi:hypothetical protein
VQARVVAAGQGARWLAEGWTLFRGAPVGWLLAVFAYLALTQVMALVPVIGGAAAAILMPGLNLGFMAVARAGTRGSPFDPRLLFDGFRVDARRQLLLGIVYMGCGLAAVGATLAADTEGSLRALLSGERDMQELTALDLAAPLVAFVLAYGLAMMLFWFAPPLCAWHSLGVAKALFFSFFACLLNWRAFLAYGAVIVALMLASNALLAVLVALSAAPSRQQVVAFVLMALLALLPTLFASTYASYRDVFGYHPEG